MTAALALRRSGGLWRPSWRAVSATRQSRTNQIRNNSMQGAVAGTPGTLPTNWSTTSIGALKQTVVGIGSQSGIDYIDVRFNGTTNNTSFNFFFEPVNQVTAANGQTWAGSAFLAVVGGSVANITSIFLAVTAYNGVSFLGVIQATDVTATMPPSIGDPRARKSGSGTTSNGTTNNVTPYLLFSYSSGVAIDITLRIGWPQLELGSVPTSPIRTTSAARTGVHVSAGR